MGDPAADIDRILALDREHVIHPISEWAKHETRGARVFVGGKGVELELADGAACSTASPASSTSTWATAARRSPTPSPSRCASSPTTRRSGFRQRARCAPGRAPVSFLPADRGLRHVLFHSSGSEANEAAFRIARLYHAVQGKPEKSLILSRRWGFHGATRGAGAATGIAAYHALVAQDPGHLHVSPPYCLRCEFGKTHPGCGLPCAGDLEATILREGAGRVAAFIAEPVMGTGGILVPPPDYFAKIEAICARHDVLLILDEVITGFGRTGRWFGMEHWGIRPDLVSLAKGITSGYLPLSASLLSDRVYQTLRDRMPAGLPFMFGLTSNNHPTCCAAALANLDILEREQLVENARTTGAYLLERLRKSFSDSPIVADVRGIGMLAAIEIVRDRATRTPFPNPADPGWISRAAFERGLIARALFQCIGLAPPLCATPADVDRMVGILEELWPDAERHVLGAR